MVAVRWTVAAVLLHLCSFVTAHGHDAAAGDHKMGDMDMGGGSSSPVNDPDWYTMPSYSTLSSHSNMMTAHIVLMALAWFLVLPLGMATNPRYSLGVD
jgi:Domain of unknown function (DUF2427)